METGFDREKLKDAMHYVIATAGGRPGFGATKLYKVLWFSEARSFVLYNRPLFNATFVREKHGPVPKLGKIVREELVSDGRIKEWKDQSGNFAQWRFRSLMPASLDRFSQPERDTLHYWIQHIDKDHTAASISEQSHDYGWEIARMGEHLPLHAFLAERLRDPTEVEISAARSRLGYLGL